MATRTWDAWNYRESAAVSTGNTDLTGFSVEAVDGSIGKVDRSTFDVGSSWVVVDTGPWIFGRKVMLP
ncbi:MAG TPA: PRC-barrel domain containing protein, partial [Phycicoccus sp.]|nr:PRC-barrel domain containing protein [Phycicoccus sp.]